MSYSLDLSDGFLMIVKHVLGTKTLYMHACILLFFHIHLCFPISETLLIQTISLIHFSYTISRRPGVRLNLLYSDFPNAFHPEVIFKFPEYISFPLLIALAFLKTLHYCFYSHLLTFPQRKPPKGRSNLSLCPPWNLAHRSSHSRQSIYTFVEKMDGWMNKWMKIVPLVSEIQWVS